MTNPKIIVEQGVVSFQPLDIPEILSPPTNPRAIDRLSTLNHTIERLTTAQYEEVDYMESHPWARRALEWAQRTQQSLIRQQGSNWKPISRYAHKNASKLVEALSPNAALHWQYDPSIGTDHSYYDEKQGRWVMYIDPRRLLYASRTSPNQDGAHCTPTMTHGAVGAALHEACHTLYTPSCDLVGWLKTYEALAVSRPYEDMYINTLMISKRLPGAMPFLQHADRWTNDPDEQMETLTQLWSSADAPTSSFEFWLSALSFLDYQGRWFNKAETLTVPNETIAEVLLAMTPLTDELCSGEAVEPTRRQEIYQGIADLITAQAPPRIHEQIPELGHESTGNGATRTPLEQPLDTHSGDASTLADLFVQLTDCRPRELPKLPDAIANWAKAQNELIDNALEAGVQDMDDLVYSTATPHEFVKPQTSSERVDQLTAIFKLRNASRRAFHHGLAEGRLSQRRLHKVLRPGNAKGTIFKRRPRIDTPEAVIMLLVDGSGSMQGKPYEIASQSALELFEATKSNSDYRLLAWNYTSEGDELMVRAALQDNDDFHWPKLTGSATPGYQAMATAHRYLNENFPTQKKVILHFSDLGFTDRPGDPRSDLGALNEDRLTDHLTVVVNDTYARHNDGWSPAQLATSFPGMNVSAYTSEELVPAIQQFLLELL